MRTDVAIVGGGPAGCFAAGLIAERGFDVVVVEEHGEVGNPACCAGIVGAKGFEELGIKPGRWVLGKLRRAVIYPPSNQPVELTRGKVEAFVIDRAEFDRSLAKEAARAGAIFLLKTRCVDLKLGREPILKLRGIEGGELSARLVVGADGPTSTVARSAGLLKSNRHLKCAQAEFVAETQADAAEVYFGRSFAPGFFGWLVQAGDVCRVGLGCAEGNPLQMLRSLVKKHPVVSKKLAGGQVLNVCVGIIPKPLSRRLCTDRVLLVGDAAGQVKPLTGGGVYIGLSCAKLAAEVATRALEAEPNEKALRPYARAVKDKFGREFELGLRARRAFERMSDEDLDTILGLLGRDDVKKLVLKNFDFDHHGRLIRSLVAKAPEILRELGLRRILKYTHYLVKP
ncbi:MAG: NAD(P)/FAD-dependent oxidoreductase [Candidatus Hodarchaeaceae archaeon]|nr:NAD(P)/FAD-dependent oxidoreductase [Candidatus Hodarchaeaceae archaeon]